MALQYNRYYNIKAAGPEAIRLTTTLLQSYPVTRACFGILGKKLLDQVGFGFFNGEASIITQGEQGKDLFMLCDEAVDVYVDEKKVVQMDAPALFGDKGIVEPESMRAATIKVAEEKTCFFLKIPMGLFIRNFDDMTIEDDSFSQEIGIFYNMFKGIQNRLFEYSFVQKNLWEEANTTRALAETQKLIKTLDNRIDEDWDSSIWEVVRNHLVDSLQFQWPDGVPLDISTFRNLLRQHLDEKYPRESFKGKDADYVKRKHQIWRKWLTSTAAIILKELPADKGTIDGSQLELFNPRNYQLRIQGLIKAIEKRFLTSKTRDVNAPNSVTPESGADTIKSFFGRSEQNNTFDLKSYLNSFERKFKLKYPKRMQTQIAQRTALVAAKCENEFNESVAAMKIYLEQSQAKLSRSYKIQTHSSGKNEVVKRELLPLNKAVTRYYQHLNEPLLGRIGKVTYKHDSTPNIGYLIKTAGSKPVKEELIHVFQSQIKKLNISARLLSLDFIKNNFFLCEATPGAGIHAHDLERHYWIPLSGEIHLYAADHQFGVISPGKMIGGKGWLQNANSEEGEVLAPWKLKIPENREDESAANNHLLMVLPYQVLPWETNPSPNPLTYKTVHLPLMQWLINKQLDHISSLLPARDEIYQNWLKTEQVLRLENKVIAFENTSVSITPTEHKKIVDFVENVVGLKLERGKSFASNNLSKKLYNHILKQMTGDYPDLPAEQLGNRTYTKWRLILSEIIQITEQAEMVESALTSTPFFEIIENELISILGTFSIPKAREFMSLTGQTPYIQLPQILNALEAPDQDRQLLFDLMLSTLETYLRLLIEETRFYEQKFKSASQKRPQADVEAMQSKTIMESAAKLKQIIMQKQAAPPPPVDRQN